MIALTRTLRAGLLAAMTFLMPVAASAQFQEGVDYTRLRQQQPTDNPAKIEVIEFFSFGCPHCHHLEEVLGPWVKKLPADVQFRRVPVMFQQAWDGLGRVYYTLDAMGEANRLATPVFEAVHKQGVQLQQDKVFFEWAGKQGLDAKRVAETYQSFAINSRMSRARQMTPAYEVQSVPMLVIDGRWATSPSQAGNSHVRALAVADFLINKAREAKGGAQAAAPAAPAAAAPAAAPAAKAPAKK